MLSVHHAIVLIPILALVATGQAPTSNWDNVKMMAPGTGVRVTAGNSKPVRGKLESVTDNDLVVEAGTSTQSFSRLDIRRLEVKKKGHRVRNTFIGLGVGTAAGVGIGAAQSSGCTVFLCDLAPLVYGAIGLVAGTVTGLVWPTGGWRQVYAP